MGAVAFAQAGLVIGEDDVEHPVQAVLDAPMTAHGFGDPLPRPRVRSRALGFISGLPGFVTREADGLQTTAFEIEGGRIVAIYVMRNPDKLRHLGDGDAGRGC